MKTTLKTVSTSVCVLVCAAMFLANVAQADRVCMKASVKSNKVKPTIRQVASGVACPKGFTALFDSSVIVGTAGSPGAVGPQGPTGPVGPQGVTGPQGPAGGFTPILPSGQVLKGVYGGFFSATVAGQYFTDAVTYAAALATAPVMHFIPTGGAPIASCPGTAAAPDALPGHLCVFESSSTNRAAPQLYDPATAAYAGGKFGFGIFATSVAAGISTTYGSYAVRAQ